MGKNHSKHKGRAASPDDPRPMGKAEYLEGLAPLELELDTLARWLQHTGRRLVVLIEGRDTAGKGGVISAISHPLNPRMCRVVALPKPNDRERTQWVFQRLSGSARRSAKRCSCKAWSTVSQYLNSRMPSSTSIFSKTGACFRKAAVCSGVQ